eukprot:CAMPEP_0170519020 /NCGR_PEP_ID=MMETSP0209-20121228/4577_1 /TAXON_ID=665100 ORGANISM="Litonotus pictus, Strain P1" /NCGR_SAMPLE_ID=MMETSP0209 /ASSEMBLY_ACC=CAM_ASM_000301 /LENGTH=167 /DNA_ID=CAMNT_0010804793 /DNA_START=954 /DNA_END=1453 /DNA_ORIENTATION=+
MSYKISCLGQNGVCFGGVKAEKVCSNISECDAYLFKYSELTCGSELFKEYYYHDGYSTPLPTWCKRANTWLRYDGKYQIDEDSKIAIIMLPDGMPACIPDSSNTKCKKEKGRSLASEVDSINKGNKEQREFRRCSMNDLFWSKTHKDYWCAKAVLGKDDIEGIIKLG